MVKAEIWLRGMLAAVISGAANGAITGFAAIGIDPTHFNLAAGFAHTLSLAGVSAVMSGIIGVAAYLKQSPLPGDCTSAENRSPWSERWRREREGNDPVADNLTDLRAVADVRAVAHMDEHSGREHLPGAAGSMGSDIPATRLDERACERHDDKPDERRQGRQ